MCFVYICVLLCVYVCNLCVYVYMHTLCMCTLCVYVCTSCSLCVCMCIYVHGDNLCVCVCSVYSVCALWASLRNEAPSRTSSEPFFVPHGTAAPLRRTQEMDPVLWHLNECLN